MLFLQLFLFCHILEQRNWILWLGWLACTGAFEHCSTDMMLQLIRWIIIITSHSWCCAFYGKCFCIVDSAMPFFDVSCSFFSSPNYQEPHIDPLCCLNKTVKKYIYIFFFFHLTLVSPSLCNIKLCNCKISPWKLNMDIL